MPGLLAFLAFLISSVVRARGWLDDTDVSAWAVGVGLIAISATVMISFADAASALSLGVVTGAIAAATARTYVDD